MEKVKIANVEFRIEELQDLYFNQDKKFIVKHNAIFQIHYSENAGFSAIKIYKYSGNLPLVKRGRFILVNAKKVNDLLGKELLVD